MGRMLSDGTFKPKPSAHKQANRLAGPVRFEDALRYGTPVKVFMGAGWEKGSIERWHKDRVLVRLSRGNRSVTCYDSRNIEIL